MIFPEETLTNFPRVHIESHEQVCATCGVPLRCDCYLTEDAIGHWSLVCENCGRYFNYDSESNRLEQYAHVPPALIKPPQLTIPAKIALLILMGIYWLMLPGLIAVLWLCHKVGFTKAWGPKKWRKNNE
jgi:hypothetical protein